MKKLKKKLKYLGYRTLNFNKNILVKSLGDTVLVIYLIKDELYITLYFNNTQNVLSEYDFKQLNIKNLHNKTILNEIKSFETDLVACTGVFFIPNEPININTIPNNIIPKKDSLIYKVDTFYTTLDVDITKAEKLLKEIRNAFSDYPEIIRMYKCLEFKMRQIEKEKYC